MEKSPKMCIITLISRMFYLNFDLIFFSEELRASAFTHIACDLGLRRAHSKKGGISFCPERAIHTSPGQRPG